MERKIKSTVSFKMVPKEVKYFSTNVTRHMQDPQADNHKILIKDDLLSEDIPCPWTVRLPTTEMSILSKLICSFNATAIKIQAKFVCF